MTTPDQTAHSAPDGDGEVCRCQVVSWERDPYEPHIPSQPEWEQADDCPVHPQTATEPTRDQGAGGYSCCPCCEPGGHAHEDRVDQGGYTERNGHEQPCRYDHDRPFDPSDLEGD